MSNMDKRLRELLGGFKARKGVTIPVLQTVQDEYGYIPKEVFPLMEEILGIPASKAYGVATFYAQFRLEPRGRHTIKLCNGTACHVKGAETLLGALRNDLGLQDEDTTKDMLFTLEVVSCLGCCSLAPVMMVDDVTYGEVTIEKTRSVVANIRKKDQAGEMGGKKND